MRKLILFLYRKRIKSLVEQYKQKKDSYAGKNYLKKLKAGIDVKRALKQQFIMPDFSDIFLRLIDLIDNFIYIIFHLIVLIICPFYNTYKLLIFPFLLYRKKVIDEEMLKRIKRGE